MKKTPQTAPVAAADTSDAGELRKLYHLSEEDLQRVEAVGERLLPELDHYVDDFYTWMRREPFYLEFFADEVTQACVEVVVNGKRRIKLGDFFHQLHHRYFECNYGIAETPWDKWFVSFDDGTPEARQRIRARMKAKREPVAIG